MIRDDGEVKCLSCGREARTLTDMKRYYEQNKEDILSDIKDIGAKKTRKKWQIPAGTFSGLQKRWIPLEEQKPPQERRQPTNNQLPQLPIWSDTWPVPVQEKWLDIWLYLATKK